MIISLHSIKHGKSVSKFSAQRFLESFGLTKVNSASYPDQFALSELPEEPWNQQVPSHPKSPRTTGNEAEVNYDWVMVSDGSHTEEKSLRHAAMVAKFLDEQTTMSLKKWIHTVSNFIDLI